MKKLWSDEAWEEYLIWLKTDIKKVEKINCLIKSIEREGVMRGLGKPEPLKYRKGYSRRITEDHRLIYDVDKNTLYI